ncbi:MAG: hypothetical protein IJN87_00360 [Firmicutes bacterium]|nr:hypothetical protein [Bacillota bacterium]
MAAWGTAIFSDDIAAEVRNEYNALLSIGKNDEQIEELLCGYYASILNCGDPDEAVFWFALALCSWKKGRLSDKVKSKALSSLDQGIDLERWRMSRDRKDYMKRKKVLEDLKKTLLSPMPPQKKMRKPNVHHCPWKVGSLLAYRIITNREALEGDPCFGKYALLRVIKIDKNPVSKLAPNEYYDESMLVGLYGWIGAEIPDSKITCNLEYIPIDEEKVPEVKIDFSILESLSEESRKRVEQALTEAFQGRIETCAKLNWLPYKNHKGDITCIDCDEIYQERIPDFFNTSILSYSFTHFLPFDVTLSKRLRKYLNGEE